MNKMMVLLLCVMHSAQGMEVWGETKPEKRFLMHETKQSYYSSFLNGSIVPKLQDDKLKTLLSFSAKLLPIELKEHIAINWVKIYLAEEKMSNFKSHPFLMLNLLCRAQERCLLRIGNKEFGWKDIIVLTKEHREILFNTYKPNRCYTCLTGLDNVTVEGSNNIVYAIATCIDKLQGKDVSRWEVSCHLLNYMPIHITKDLIIQKNECYGPILCGCCPTLGLTGSLLGLSGIICSSSQVINTGGVLIVPACIWYGAARTGVCDRCCVRQYSVDKDKYL